MFSPSPFAAPRGSFRVPVDPPGQDPGGCPSVTVTFAREWLPVVLGALDQLVLQATWKGTQAEQSQAQGESMYLKQLFTLAAETPCNPQPEPQQSCCGGDDDMACCFRVQDNKFQQFCCGTWQTILDLSSISGGQPGPQPETPQPGGGAASTCFTLSGPGRAFLPWPVSAGDTLLLSNPSGAVNDGSEVPWRGPQGETFLLNNYVQFSERLNGTDLLPTEPHETVLATFDGGMNWYNIWNGDIAGNPQPFTVPTGVSNVQPVIAINVPPSTIVNGDYSFCVQVTNNQVTSWSHTLDFTLSSYGFVDASSGGGSMVWVPGVGWQGTTGPGIDLAIKHTAASAYTLTRGKYQGTDTALLGSNGTAMYHPSPTVVVQAVPLTVSPFSLDSGAVSIGPSTDLQLLIQDGAGTSTFTGCHVEGNGPDPFPGAPTP